MYNFDYKAIGLSLLMGAKPISFIGLRFEMLRDKYWNVVNKQYFKISFSASAERVKQADTDYSDYHYHHLIESLAHNIGMVAVHGFFNTELRNADGFIQLYHRLPVNDIDVINHIQLKYDDDTKSFLKMKWDLYEPIATMSIDLIFEKKGFMNET